MQPNVLIEAQKKVVSALHLNKFSEIIERIFLSMPVVNFAPAEKFSIENTLWEIRSNIEELLKDKRYAFIIHDTEIDKRFNREDMLGLMAAIRNTDIPAQLRNNVVYVSKYLRMKSIADALILSTSLNIAYLFHDLKYEDENYSTVNFEIILQSGDELSINKLEEIIHSIHILINSIALLYGEAVDKPIIEFIESGSAMLIAVKTAKKVATFITRIYNFYYEYVRNFELLTIKLKAEVALADLAVNREIAEQIKLGLIDPVRGEKLSGNVIHEVEKLYSENVVLAEHHTGDISPRKLLAAKQTLQLPEGSSESKDANTLKGETGLSDIDSKDDI